MPPAILLALTTVAAPNAPAGGPDSLEARAAVRLCLSLEAPADDSLSGCRQALALGLHAEWALKLRLYLTRRLAALGRWDEVIGLYAELSRVRPEEAEWPLRLGSALFFGSDRRSEAEAAFREALRRDPGQAGAWALLGAALAAQGRNVDALAAFARERAIDPRYLDSRPALLEIESAARSGTAWP